MSQTILLIVAVVCVFATVIISEGANASAQANTTMNFQGKIVAGSTRINLTPGTPACLVSGVANDSCDFRVNIYSDQVGGTLLYREVHNNIELSNYNGVFNLNINNVCADWTPVVSANCGGSGLVWGSDPTVYLEIEFDPSGNADFAEGEIFTRKLYNSVPTAEFADDSDYLDGISKEGFVQIQPVSNTFSFVKALGSSASDEAYSVKTDASGNVYVSGIYTGTVDFDENNVVAGDTVTSVAGIDGFVAKYNASGVLQWVKSIGSTGTEASQDARADASGNVYVTGYFTGTTDFDTTNVVSGDTVASSGTEDIFIAKYNSSGVLQWVNTPGGTSTDVARKLSIDSLGNIIVGGTFNATVDFDENNVIAGDTHTSNGGALIDFFVAKYNPSGVLQWAKGLGSTAVDNLFSLGIDSSNNIITVGYIQGSTDFDEGAVVAGDTLTTVGGLDMFIAKYNSSGLLQWVKALGGAGADFGNDVAADYAGNIYVTGNMQGTVDFDEGAVVAGDTHTTAGDYDAFIAKYNSSGLIQWVKVNGSTSPDYGNGITVDGNGEVYATGFFEGTVDFDESNVVDGDTHVGAGSQDSYIAKYNTLGRLKWARGIGSTIADRGNSIALAPNGSIYAVGLFGNTVDFAEESVTAGDTVSSAGGFEIYIAKYNQFGQEVTGDSSNTIISIDYTGVAAPNLIDLKLAGSSAFRVINNGDTYVSGKLGVGIPNPTQELDVSGNIQVSGNILTTTAPTETPTQVFSSVKTKVDQGVSTQWDLSNDLAIDSAGIFYSAGQFSGNTNFGGVTDTTTPAGQSDWYTAKYNPDFTVSWIQRIGGAADDVGGAVSTDTTGAVYVTGYTNGNWSYESTPQGVVNNVVAAGYNASLFKYNSAGAYQWHRTFISTGLDGGQGVAVDNGDNIIAVGIYEGTLTLQGCAGTLANNGRDGYIVKYSSTGICLWSNTFSSAGTDSLWEVKTDGQDIYVAGDDDIGGDLTAILRKYSTNSGAPVWTATVNGTGGDSSGTLDTDAYGNVYFAGDAGTGTVTVTHGSGAVAQTFTSVPAGRRFIVKYNSQGVMQWAQLVALDNLSKIAVDGNNNLLVTGFISANGADYYIRKYYHDGVFAYMSSGGHATNQDHTMSIVADLQNRPVIGGYTNGTFNMRFLSFFKYESAFTGSNIGTTTNPFANVYAGMYRGRELNISNFDIAEEYEVEDESIGPGDVVRFKADSTNNLVVERAGGEGKPYDGEVTGVISTAPGLYLKNWEEEKTNGRPIALKGRVPVKVSLENGPIKRGDYLTAASKPGYAMKATQGGYIIGRAMEDFDGGDSEGVQEYIEEKKEELTTVISEVKLEVAEQGGDVSELEVVNSAGEEVTFAEIEAKSTEIIAEVTQPMANTDKNLGRIMMYIDLSYVGQEEYDKKQGLIAKFGIEDFGTESGHRFFEVVSGDDGVKLVAGGDVEIAGDLKVNVIRARDLEDITVRLASGKDLKVVDSSGSLVLGLSEKGRLSLKEAEGSSLGRVVVKAAETEVFVSDKGVNEHTKVLLSVNAQVEYELTVKPNEGFSLKLAAKSETDVEFNYLLLN